LKIGVLNLQRCKKSSEEKSRYEETTGLKNVKKENSNEKRPSVKESHPEMDSKTIIKTLGAMWRALSEEEQQSYKMM